MTAKLTRNLVFRFFLIRDELFEATYVCAVTCASTFVNVGCRYVGYRRISSIFSTYSRSAQKSRCSSPFAHPFARSSYMVGHKRLEMLFIIRIISRGMCIVYVYTLVAIAEVPTSIYFLRVGVLCKYNTYSAMGTTRIGKHDYMCIVYCTGG